MSSGLPNSIYDSAFSSFDPYSIFQNQDQKTLTALGLDFATNTAKKRFLSVISKNCDIFGRTDAIINALIKHLKKTVRKNNRELLRSLVRFHVQHPSIDIRTGLNTLMVLAGAPIGSVAASWYKQLENPARGEVVWTFARNIPKSIKEGSNYMVNVVTDLGKEQDIPCKYYFDELNQTLIAYLSLTCYYSHRDFNTYINQLEYSGYKWIGFQDVGKKEMYFHIYKYVLCPSASVYGGRTLEEIYSRFDLWEKTVKLLYMEIKQPIADACSRVNEDRKYFLEFFSDYKKIEAQMTQTSTSMPKKIMPKSQNGQGVIWQCASGDESVAIDICQKNGRSAFCMKVRNRPTQVELYEINKVYSVKTNVLNISADIRDYKLVFPTSEEANVWKQRLQRLVKGRTPGIPDTEAGKLISQGEAEPCIFSIIRRKEQEFLVIELQNRPFRVELASVDELSNIGGNGVRIISGKKTYMLEFSSNASRQKWAECIGNLL